MNASTPPTAAGILSATAMSADRIVPATTAGRTSGSKAFTATTRRAWRREPVRSTANERPVAAASASTPRSDQRTPDVNGGDEATTSPSGRSSSSVEKTGSCRRSCSSSSAARALAPLSASGLAAESVSAAALATNNRSLCTAVASDSCSRSISSRTWPACSTANAAKSRSTSLRMMRSLAR